MNGNLYMRRFGAFGGRTWMLAVVAVVAVTALTGCGNSGVRFGLDQNIKAIDEALTHPSLPASVVVVLEDAKALGLAVQKDIGKPPLELDRKYDGKNVQEALNLIKQQRATKAGLTSAFMGFASTYLPFGAAIPFALGFYRKFKENKLLKEGLQMVVGSIETAKKPEDAKAQLKKAAHPSVEDAVRSMNQGKAASHTESA